MIYLFLGESFLRERALRRQLEGLRASLRNYEEIHLDGEELEPGRLAEELSMDSLFAPSKIILIRRADQIAEELAELLEERGLPRGCHLLLEAEKLPSRSKLHQLVHLKGKVESYPKLDRRGLTHLARELLREQGVELTEEALRYLLEVADRDPWRLAKEIEKLALWPRNGPLDLPELEELLLGVHQGKLFPLLDRLSERRPEALALLEELLQGGEDPTKLFFMLAAQVRGLLMAKSLAEEGLSLEEIASRMGQPPWLVRKRLTQAQGFTEEELIRLIHLLQERDAKLKRGECEPEEALFELALAMLELEPGSRSRP